MRKKKGKMLGVDEERERKNLSSFIFFEYLIGIFLSHYRTWSLRLNCATSASGKSTLDEESAMSPRTEGPSSISASEPKVSDSGKLPS